MTKRTPEATRAKLLDAAIMLIVEQGAARLTLNAVAHMAQVSKGGLLHHFPTKDALFYGIDDLATHMWDIRLQDSLSKEPEGQPGRWSRAYIRATFDRQPEEQHVLLALGRIVSVYPPLLERWHAMYAQAGEHLFSDGLPVGRVTTIQVACDGLWLGEIVGLQLISDRQRDAMRADLMRLTNDI